MGREIKGRMWEIRSHKGTVVATGETEGQTWMTALMEPGYFDGWKFMRVVHHAKILLGWRAVEVR